MVPTRLFVRLNERRSVEFKRVELIVEGGGSVASRAPNMTECKTPSDTEWAVARIARVSQRQFGCKAAGARWRGNRDLLYCRPTRTDYGRHRGGRFEEILPVAGSCRQNHADRGDGAENLRKSSRHRIPVEVSELRMVARPSQDLSIR